MSLAFFSKSSGKAKVDDSNKPRQHRHTKSHSSSTSMYDPLEPVRILNALAPNLPSTTQSILPYHPSRSQSVRHTTSISRLEPHYARSGTLRVSAPSAYHPRPQSPVEMIPDRMSQSPANSEVVELFYNRALQTLCHVPRPLMSTRLWREVTYSARHHFPILLLLEPTARNRPITLMRVATTGIRRKRATFQYLGKLAKSQSRSLVSNRSVHHLEHSQSQRSQKILEQPQPPQFYQAKECLLSWTFHICR